LTEGGHHLEVAPRRPPGKGETDAGSDVGFGFAEAGHAVAFLPLTAFFERFDTFETLQNVALYDEATGALEAFVLGHDVLEKCDWTRLKDVKGAQK
jgi:hypothetical protein